MKKLANFIASKKSSNGSSVPREKQLQAKLRAVKKLGRLPQEELDFFRDEFLVDYTYNSNAMEDSTLTLPETSIVLYDQTVEGKDDKDVQDALAHRNAYKYLEKIYRKDALLTEDEIKAIHQVLFDYVGHDEGEYRQIPIYIMGSNNNPVQPHLIPSLMAELIEKNRQRASNMDIIERVALFHLEFEAIHPFIDGNGRTGRLILNLDLIRNGYPPITIYYAERDKYYEAFNHYRRTGSSDPMCQIIYDNLNQRLNAYLEKFGGC